MDAQKAATGTQQQQQPQSQELPTFCYTNGTSTMNLAQLTTTDDNKTCYIQPIGYNYLINQFQNGANFVALDGRVQVLNKPMGNTVSSISFKCDVCGAMFSQLGHLNQHKRLHVQDGSADAVQVATGAAPGQETITVVTSAGGQSFLQGAGGLLTTEGGQALGQIQIVTAESLEAAQQQHQQQQQQQQQQHHHHQEVTIVPNPMHQQHHQQAAQQTQQITITSAPTAVVQSTGKVGRGAKCSLCGGARRKGSKGGRCEACVKREQLRTATQIFVDPDGEVKFEISEMEMEEDIVEEVSTDVQEVQVQAVPQEEVTTATAAAAANKKKRNSTLVSKCNRCNGTGLIYVEASGSTTNCEANGGHSETTVTVAGGGRVGVVVSKKDRAAAAAAAAAAQQQQLE